MFRFIIKRKVYFVLFFVLSGIDLFFTMKLQLWKGQLLDTALGKTAYSLFTLMLLCLGAMIFASLFSYLYSLVKSKLVVTAEADLRKTYFDALLKKTMGEYINIPEGKISADYTDKIDVISSQYFYVWMALTDNALIFSVTVITLLTINIQAAIVTVLLLMIPLIVPTVLKKILAKVSKEKMEAVEKHFSAVRTWLKGIDIIKVFSCEQYIIFRYDKINEFLRKKQMDAINVSCLEIGVSFFVSAIVNLLMTAYCAYYVYKGVFSIGEFYTIMSLIGILSRPMYWTANLLKTFFSSRPVRDAMIEFIDAKTETGEIGNLNEFNIDAVGLSFSYNEKKVLNNTDFTFKQNEKILILGESGSGKSTIMRLLLGMYAPDSGSLTIGGAAPKKIKNIADIISIQQQEAYIFKMNLVDNLFLDKDISEERVKEVLDSLGLNKYTQDKYLKETVIGETYGFSGGEKKRISIARAVLHKRPIMIFDEPLANIDNENIERVKKIIFGIKDSTVIIISHIADAETKKMFDRIYKFDTTERRLYEEAV
ncbi:ABC transporter transmembrane domain-containing protein [Treponema denticola]|uniref:ABC transporter transmembrane domain-containing protein n=1 Tax=Treponema denticola TaxID=158 RepID=UPI0020A59CC2|nr:ABC transporter ATP-binding protein [Treponema denticola]UTC81882.1 ABC transporter ATP-binding protein [Treponema denticola]